jgi:glycolate oxidase FAD binding subunit
MPTIAPTSEQEARTAVAEALAAASPLALGGGGTKAQMGRPGDDRAALSSSCLTGITLYEPAEMVIGARAGTPLSEIERTLALRNQQLVFEPIDYRPLLGSSGEPTIGAVAAANLSGPRRVQAGAARDSLIGVRFVNGRGELIKSGGRVVKNVTGLDLVKLLAGSWGTLGFLTEVTFKVLPKPERVATVLLRGLDEPGAAAAMSTALGSPYDVTGAAHFPAGLIGGAQTVIRIEGFAHSVDHRAAELRRLFRRQDPDLLEGEAGAAIWRAVRDVTPFASDISDEAVWRVSVAPTRGHVLTAAIAQRLACRWLYDWGGGLVWLACASEGDAGAAVIRDALKAFGGHATLVRAPREVRASVDVFQPLTAPLRQLTAGIKRSLDPAGIFNPGRMYAGI